MGITYRQLDYWARTDLMRPSISDAQGSGTQRVYAYTDLLQLKVVKQLLDAGVSLRKTRKAIECMRASGTDIASASLVIADDQTVLANSGEELFDLLRGGQGVLSIVLMQKIFSDVDAGITEFRARVRRGTRRAGHLLVAALRVRQRLMPVHPKVPPGRQRGSPAETSLYCHDRRTFLEAALVLAR